MEDIYREHNLDRSELMKAISLSDMDNEIKEKLFDYISLIETKLTNNSYELNKFKSFFKDLNGLLTIEKRF